MSKMYAYQTAEEEPTLVFQQRSPSTRRQGSPSTHEPKPSSRRTGQVTPLPQRRREPDTESGERSRAERPPIRTHVPSVQVAPSVLPVAADREADTERKIVAPKPPETPAAPAAPKSTAATMWFNNFIVSAYKLAGFAILSLILFGLVSYLAVSAFYFVNKSWATPTILSPTDERVIKLNSELAAQQSMRDRLEAERLATQGLIEDQERVVLAEEGFQKSFELAMNADSKDAAEELAQLQQIAKNYGGAHGAVVSSTRSAYSEMSKERLKQLYDAHVIDADGLAKGSMQLAQIASASAAMAEKAAEIGSRVSLLSRRVDSLNTAKGSVGAGELGKVGEYSYDVLQIKHLYDRSILDSEKAKKQVEVLKKTLGSLDGSIGRYDALIKSIEEAPYLMAANKQMAMAFVPYDNMPNVSEGHPVYTCKLGFLICKKVGTVEKILDSEVQGHHPMRNEEIRGQMVKLALTDGNVARSAVLHIGRAPLFL